MRKGWEYKRFDEVFDLQMGKTPDRKNPEYFGGNNVWVSIRDLGDKEITDSNEHITDLAVSNSNIRKVKRGTVIMSFKLTVGKCGIAATDLYTNEAIMAFNTKESFDINSSFLYYYLQCYHWVGSNKAVMGTTLNKATISKQYISIPPLSTQLAIVSELDKINELIRLKKEQLKDFDNLAQSLFYEMFGDPVENEKGWEVKKLGEISSLICNGNTPKGGSEVYVDNGILFLRSQNVWKNRLDLDDVAFIDEATHKSLKKSALNHHDLLITKTGRVNTENSSLGRTALFEGEDGSANINGHVYLVRLKEGMVHKYVLYILISNSYRELIRRTCVGGIDKRQLNKNHIEDFPIIFPPLSLQHLFAQRIEQIEREKSEVQKSIQDLETLLASRMQYWFE